MKVGRRLAIKLLNASKFALSFGDAPTSAVSAPLDRALLATLADLVVDATTAFDGYDYARALERTEAFFWTFCDDHIELVKGRAFGTFGDDGAASAKAALSMALSVLQRLFAPFLPFVTEEVWSWWMDGSIHQADWPRAEALRAVAGDIEPELVTVAADVIQAVRRAKSEASVSMRADVASVTVTDSPERLARLALVADDVREAGRIAELHTNPGEFHVDVVLA
jgi:valyl-tRNA synthetase